MRPSGSPSRCALNARVGSINERRTRGESRWEPSSPDREKMSDREKAREAEAVFLEE